MPSLHAAPARRNEIRTSAVVRDTAASTKVPSTGRLTGVVAKMLTSSITQVASAATRSPPSLRCCFCLCMFRDWTWTSPLCLLDRSVDPQQSPHPDLAQMCSCILVCHPSRQARQPVSEQAACARFAAASLQGRKSGSVGALRQQAWAQVGQCWCSALTGVVAHESEDERCGLLGPPFPHLMWTRQYFRQDSFHCHQHMPLGQRCGILHTRSLSRWHVLMEV